MKYLVAAFAGAVLVGALWFSCDQGSTSTLDWRDSVAAAEEEVLEEVWAGVRPQLERWRDSAERLEQERDSLKRQMEARDRDFSDALQEAIASAPEAQQPMLQNLGEIHVEVVEACQGALAACERELDVAEDRLAVFRDSIVPALESAREAQEALAEEAKRLANPPFLVRVGRNLEIIGFGVVVGAVTTCALMC